MVKCKSCEKEFHACRSCDIWFNWEEKYCSERCWKESEEYEENKRLIVQFYDTLAENSKEVFLLILGLDSDWLDEEIFSILDL